ncbi:forkhead box protein R1 isoform X2 [Trematomus bernacchii]|uniref:forkhead box protein R1 isoform X2 n=1 Tax=Trematomus bernacchii TaxID=40690 RepID=UPI00146A9E64|nr:forkhead box protein R1 isoform X2 [Trematomus bernacchii]
MTLQLKTKARLFDLHCSVGLTDWDMDKELKLATTTDQFDHDTFVKPNLWLLVNPNIASPIQYGDNSADLQTPCEPADEIQKPPRNPAGTRQLATELHTCAPHGAPLKHEMLHSTDYMIKNEDVSCAPAKNRRKGRTPKTRDSRTLKPGCWPRPPVNYCILIALALKSSHTGSLKVQQIYNFTREHFPFFQTAPDGWKNTIRHNLCFNNSFRKTCNQLCRDGKRKSCFWHLTLDGHRRLKDEISTLTGESFKQLEKSMSRPDVIQSLFAV